MTHRLVFLDDGETYSSIEGTLVVTVTDQGMNLLEEGVKLKNLPQEHVLRVKEIQFWNNQ